MNVHHLARYSAIILISAFLFLPFLGHVHLFDWDEINFAECAREMIVTHNYLVPQIDFQPFWEKPPLFIWLQVISMKLFGINEYAARFPNAVLGIVTLVSLYYIGNKVMNERTARWWVVLYVASWLPHFYFKTGIIDPTFNYFVLLAFFQVHLLRFSSDKVKHASYAGLFLGLAILTKGPAAALIALLCLFVYLIINKGIWGYRWRDFATVAVLSFLPFALWFLGAVLTYGWNYGSWFINEFVTYQLRLFRTEDAGHGGPFFYHFIVLLIGCFPASVFLLQYNLKRTSQTEQARDFSRWMWVLFWVTLLLFSLVKTKIVHYSSLCYFPLTYLAAVKVEQLDAHTAVLKKGVKLLLLLIGCLWAFALMAIPFAGIYKDRLVPFIDDAFAVGNLQAPVSWTMAESLWGLLYLSAVIVAVLWMRKSFKNGMWALAITQVLLIQITVLHFTPKVEAYSQRTAIRFFKSFVGKDVYVAVLGYKSYAQLFYTKKQPPADPRSLDTQWLLDGDIDKPAYFICKNVAAKPYRQLPQLEEIGEQNGFVFFRRKQ